MELLILSIGLLLGFALGRATAPRRNRAGWQPVAREEANLVFPDAPRRPPDLGPKPGDERPAVAGFRRSRLDRQGPGGRTGGEP